ncbi:MAG: T9SS type A sorting domain-containing protein [Prolixibacteraceae bacterium]|nr:T9SS type A sorting domain-containing protein [Prolixibacteraceae bacterium]
MREYIESKLILFVLVGVFPFCLHLKAANHTDTVSVLISPPENRIDWSVAGVQGDIPEYANIIDVTQLGSKADGTTNNQPIIQNAINEAQPGTVLYFPPGEYFFSATLVMKDSVVIRGACSDQTTLKFDLSGEAAPSVWFRSNDVGNETPVTAGYEKGSDVITVEGPSRFKVSEHLEILQDNIPEKMYTEDTWNTNWAQNVTGQMIKVVEINGNQLTLEHQLYYGFSPEYNVRVKPAKMITGAGLENLKVIRLDDGNDYNLRFYYASNCWIRNIEGSYSDRGHVEILFSSHIEIRDSYFHHAYDYGGGGHGYGVNLADHPSDCLIENNIFHYLRHAFLAKEGAIGNVFAYNYSREPHGNPNDIAMHGHYGMYNLIEGNIVQKIIAGDYWGPSGPGNTFFRNRVETDNIIIQDYTHDQNIIGNEIVKGGISIAGNSKNTWRHSNYNSKVLLDDFFDGDLPPSLYLDEKPAFFNTLPWPAIGPESEINEHTIPAKKRWDDGEQLVPCINNGSSSFYDNKKNRIPLKIFPNPVKTAFTLIHDYNNPVHVKIFNIYGNEIHNTCLTQKENEINFERYLSGIYFLLINSKEETWSGKILKR